MSRSARCARAEEPQGEAKANDCPGRGAGAGAGPWAERRIPAWPYGRRSHSTVLSSWRSSRPHVHTHTHADAPPHAHAHTPSHARAHARARDLSRARARTRQLPDNGDPAGLTFAPPAVPATDPCASDAILLKNIFSGRFCPCEVTDQASRAFRRWPLRPGGLRGPAVVSRVFPPAACAYPMIFPGRCSAGCRRGLGGLRSCGWNGFQVCT